MKEFIKNEINEILDSPLFNKNRLEEEAEKSEIRLNIAKNNTREIQHLRDVIKLEENIRGTDDFEALYKYNNELKKIKTEYDAFKINSEKNYKINTLKKLIEENSENITYVDRFMDESISNELIGIASIYIGHINYQEDVLEALKNNHISFEASDHKINIKNFNDYLPSIVGAKFALKKDYEVYINNTQLGDSIYIVGIMEYNTYLHMNKYKHIDGDSRRIRKENDYVDLQIKSIVNGGEKMIYANISS